MMLAFSGTPLFASSQPYISGHGINFGIGNKYHAETDLNLPGPVSPLVFKRTYNSQSTESGILGYGWNSSLTELLLIQTGRLILVQPGGRQVHFLYNSTFGNWSNESGKVRTITSGPDGYSLMEPDGTRHNFDTSGRLVELRDKNNNSLLFTYTGTQLTSVADTFGRGIVLSYTASGSLETLATPIGNFTYTYDANGNLEYVHKPNSTTIQYLYEDPNDAHNLTGILDETGSRTMTVAYDTSDRVTSSAFAEGAEQMAIEYLDGLQRRVTNILGVATTYQLEVKNGVVRVASFTGPGCSACGSDTGSDYVYDDRQLITQVTDAKGVVTTNTYDVWGNLQAKTEAVGTPEERTTGYTYTAGTDRIETITRDSVANPGQQAVTTMIYDAQGNLQAKTESGFAGLTEISRTTFYTYDSYGRIETIDGPRTDVQDITTFSYYPNTPDQGYNRGNLYTVQNALGHTTTYAQYNSYGKPDQIITPNGTLIDMTYDAMGRIKTRASNNITTTYNYNAAGQLSGVDLPGSRTISYYYTASGKPEIIVDSLGNSITYTYDPAGQRIKQEIKDLQGVLRNFVSYSYEDTGDLDKTTQPDGSFVDLNYDAVGNLVAKINAPEGDTQYGYDALNRLTQMVQAGTATTEYQYDRNDNLKNVTDANGNATAFTYDDFGRKTSQMSPDTGLTLSSYDESDNLVASTDSRGIAVTYDYDELNRLTAVRYPEATQNVSYLYDQNGDIGQLTTMQDSTGTTAYAYDVLGRLVTETRTQSGLVFTTGYGYNTNSELTTITYPGGRVITYSRDSAGNVSSVTSTIDGTTTTLADALAYLPFGPTTEMALGNGMAISNSYDQQYRLTSATAGNRYNRDYTYYATGNVQSIVDNLDPTASQNFAYDDLGRLTGAQGKYGSYNWTYDNVSNRLSQVTAAEATSYTYEPGSNKLTQASGTSTTTYAYDEAGNMTGRDNVAFTWDQNNRLRSAVKRKTLGTYGYDGQGLRTTRTAGTSTIHSVYDSTGNMLLEADAAGKILNEFVYLNGTRLALLNRTVTTAKVKGQIITTVTNHTYYNISDHLSTAQLKVDDQGTVVWQGNYTPFGGVDVVMNSVPNNFRFPGQVFDAETGLHYNWNRYYDPATGRYISADPIGLDGGMNLYAYTGANPVNYTDPEGLQIAVPGTLPAPGVGGGTTTLTPGQYQDMLDDLGIGDSISQPGDSGKKCDDEDDCKDRLSDWQLKKFGIDAHELKYDVLGKRAQISRYELCKCKSGAVVVRFKGCTGPIIPTGLSI